MKKTILCAITAAALLAPSAGAAPVPAPKDPPAAATGSRLLDLERWLQLKVKKLANPFGTEGPVSPRPRNDTSTCDPSRTRCPIG